MIFIATTRVRTIQKMWNGSWSNFNKFWTAANLFSIVSSLKNNSYSRSSKCEVTPQNSFTYSSLIHLKYSEPVMASLKLGRCNAYFFKLILQNLAYIYSWNFVKNMLSKLSCLNVKIESGNRFRLVVCISIDWIWFELHIKCNVDRPHFDHC